MSSNDSPTVTLHTDLPIAVLRQRVRALFAGDITLGKLDPAGTQYYGAFTDHWFRISRSREDKLKFPDLVGHLKPSGNGLDVAIEFNPAEEAMGILMMFFCISAPVAFTLVWAFVEDFWAKLNTLGVIVSVVVFLAIVGAVIAFMLRKYRARIAITSERFQLAVEDFARFIEAIPGAKPPSLNGDARSLHHH